MDSPDPVSAFFLGTAATATAPATAGLFGAGGAVTAGGIGTGLALGGTALSALSGVRSAEAGRQAAKAEAKQAEISAGIEERQARRRAAEIIGKQQNIAAGAGLSTTTGSPLEFMLDSAREAEIEAQNIRYGSSLRQRRSLYEAGLSSGRKAGVIGEGIFRGGSLLYQFAQRSKGVSP